MAIKTNGLGKSSYPFNFIFVDEDFFKLKQKKKNEIHVIRKAKI